MRSREYGVLRSVFFSERLSKSPDQMRMSAEQYRRIAADYESMAERASDETLVRLRRRLVPGVRSIRRRRPVLPIPR